VPFCAAATKPMAVGPLFGARPRAVGGTGGAGFREQFSDPLQSGGAPPCLPLFLRSEPGTLKTAEHFFSRIRCRAFGSASLGDAAARRTTLRTPVLKLRDVIRDNL